MGITNAARTLLRDQDGLIARQQALRAGCSPRQIERALAAGELEVVLPGVYRSTTSPATARQRLLAPCLATGDGVLSHRSASARWGARIAPAFSATTTEITVRRERLWHLPDVILHRSRDLDPEQVTTLDGLPITTPTRTLVDLGQVVPWKHVQEAFDHFQVAGLVTLESTRAALALHSRRGRRGCGALRRVVESWGPIDVPVESVLEAALLRLCRDHGLPLPVAQVEVDLLGRIRRVDFAYVELKLALEVDGYAFHSTKAGFEDDRARRNELTLAGWTVLHFTWAMVIHNPAAVARQIRIALEQAGRAVAHGRPNG